MSKQSAAEPSMEDILASIRKMISDERLGPRPLPDQMSRTPFGDTAAEPIAREAARERKSEAPDPQPSFSSLADALKAAAKPSAQHRTLDEKIADMLDKGPAPQPINSDPLAVFAAARPRSAEPAGSGGFGSPRSARPFDPIASPQKKSSGIRTARDEPLLPPTEETVQALGRSLNMPGRSERKPSDPGTAVPLPGEMSSARSDPFSPHPTNRLAAGQASGVPGSLEGKTPDDKTVISIPTRGAGLFGSTLPGAPRNGSLNGSSVAPFGLRPLPGSTPSARTEDVIGPSKDTRRPDEAKRADEPSLEDVAKGTRPITGLSDTPLKPLNGEPNFDFLGGSREEPTVENESNDAGEDFGSAADAKSAKSDDADPLVATALGASEPAESEGAKLQVGPSEALLDAVVDMVHSEPSSLSVFTSGSAFINGVGTRAILDEKPLDEKLDDKPKDVRKLDRAAAELLRPMLRQWLAENMPRIVEEALRSELDSSVSAGKDPDKA